MPAEDVFATVHCHPRVHKFGRLSMSLVRITQIRSGSICLSAMHPSFLHVVHFFDPANLCECLLTCDMILYSSNECFHGTRCKCSEFIVFCECKWIKVFDRIKDLQRECGDSNITWKLLGTRICRRAWRTLHCIGPRVTND